MSESIVVKPMGGKYIVLTLDGGAIPVKIFDSLDEATLYADGLAMGIFLNSRGKKHPSVLVEFVVG